MEKKIPDERHALYSLWESKQNVIQTNVLSPYSVCMDPEYYEVRTTIEHGNVSSPFSSGWTKKIHKTQLIKLCKTSTRTRKEYISKSWQLLQGCILEKSEFAKHEGILTPLVKLAQNNTMFDSWDGWEEEGRGGGGGRGTDTYAHHNLLVGVEMLLLC